jgi:hypothetical protein
MEKDLFSFLPGGGKKADKNSCASASAPGGCGAETEEELERMRNQMSAGRMRGGGQVNEMKKSGSLFAGVIRGKETAFCGRLLSMQFCYYI